MSIKFHEWSDEQLTFPEFYKTGDRDWLGRQLARLTFDQRKKICKEYREVYLKQGRNTANKWLLDYCNDNGKSHEQMHQVQQTSAQNPLQSRIDQIRKQPNSQRKTILGMADNTLDKE